jgi:16S rRNA (guanine966-N2)-methyltransferase
MTRIVAGAWGGRRLLVPSGDGTRPTSDRVRESVFSALHGLLGEFDSLRVLDLYAGTGALGLEALSRGAASCDFVEANAKAAAVVRANARELGADTAVVHTMKAERFTSKAPYDLVFVDPPYAVTTDSLVAILANLPLSDDALVVVERSSRDTWYWPDSLVALRDKKYGDTHVWYGERVPSHD